MRKLMSVVTLTLLLTINTLGATDSASTTEPSGDYLSLLIAIVVTSIAIPNLLKSHQ